MKIISLLLLTVLSVGCGGYGSSSMTTAPQPGVVPAITGLSPSSASAGGPGFTLTVNGSRFASNSVVNFNGMHPTTAYVSVNQLTAMIPATAIATPGTAPVSVTNPGYSRRPVRRWYDGRHLQHHELYGQLGPNRPRSRAGGLALLVSHLRGSTPNGTYTVVHATFAGLQTTSRLRTFEDDGPGALDESTTPETLQKWGFPMRFLTGWVFMNYRQS